MENIRTIILIWGAAILIYILVINYKGTSTLLSGLTNFTTGTTKVLQGR